MIGTLFQGANHRGTCIPRYATVRYVRAGEHVVYPNSSGPLAGAVCVCATRWVAANWAVRGAVLALGPVPRSGAL